MLLFAMVGLAACEDTTLRSSVPSYPVSIRIDTRTGEFVHFVSSNIYSYITVNADGFHDARGQLILPRDMQTAYGYAGVVVYIDGNEEYKAYDMCCPHCLTNQPITMDGMFADCPTCGEQYDLGSGYAIPQKGISKEALRRYSVVYSNGIITIHN